MKKQTIAEGVAALVEPTVTALGYELWDVEYGKEGADYHLTVTIDNAAGITIDDCERVHRAIDPLLDEADPIPDFYYLDVSSPGIERVLRTEKHLSLSLGERVELRFFAALDGKKTVRGTLSAFDGETVTLDSGVYARAQISKIQTVYFD